MGQAAYVTTEKYVGEVLMQVREESLEKAMEEEKSMTKETYTTEEDGELPACTFGLDASWNKKGSGRAYDSPTGTMNACGVHCHKICHSKTLCKRCVKCIRLKHVREKKGKAIIAKKAKKIVKYTMEEKKLAIHPCHKNWDKSSKSMESEMVIQFVKSCPKKSGCYTRKIILDDDTTTPAHLKEDKGPDSKGRMPKHLSGVVVLADPTHRKRTWRNRFYKLALLKQKRCNVNKKKAKKWAKTWDTGSLR